MNWRVHQPIVRWKLAFACLGLLIAGAAHGADLKMQAEPAFVGFGLTNGPFPLAVDLANSGSDARGALHVSTGDFQMDYPVELPHGAVKRLIVYPILEYGATVDLDLSTNQGGVRGKYEAVLGQDPSSRAVLMVGDTQGDLGFLRPPGGDARGHLWDCYVKPSDAPDRPLAYANICAVMLAPGSERLSDAAVRALHVYLAAGGTVLFVGGASSPVLSDRRWADVCPVTPKLPRPVARSQFVTNLSVDSKSDNVAGPFTEMDSQPATDASVRRENRMALLARRNVGLGKALFLAFDPIEPPFTRWGGRRDLFERILRSADFDRAKGYLSQFTAATDFSEEDGSSPYVGATVYSTYGHPYRPADPFSTQLPAPTKVLWILIAYFVAIIPLNFILLKRLKRGELAWITAPLISVAFAGIFFAAARDLYSAGLSTATQGLIVASKASPDAVFVGKSQLFFPQGGEFDLKMKDVDAVFAPTQSEPYYFGYRSREEQSFDYVNPVDVGHVLVSRVDVGNLSFHEIAFNEVLPDSHWFEVQLVQSASGRRLLVTNTGRSVVRNVIAYVAGGRVTIAGSIEPGQAVRVDVPEHPPMDPSGDQYPQAYGGQPVVQYEGLGQISARTGEVVIKASVDSPIVGPNVGQVVADRQSITLAYFTGIEAEKVAL